jgi:hypothetical protein
VCAEIEVTDGWYSVKARLDPVLTEYLRRGRLFVGQKLLVQGAELQGGVEPVPPLSDAAEGMWQGRTLVHFSAQLEPCLTQENTLHTLNTPYHPLNTGYTAPTRTPYPTECA